MPASLYAFSLDLILLDNSRIDPFPRAADGFEKNEIVGHEKVSILRRRVLNFFVPRSKQSWIIVPGDLTGQ